MGTMKVPSLPIAEGIVPIPRVIHQVWVGGQPPYWVRQLWLRWDAFGVKNDFEVRRWTDNNTEHTISWRVAQEHNLTAVQMADFLRIEILALQGGLYMDSDTMPLRDLSSWVGLRPGWLAHGQSWLNSGEPTVSNAMIGMPKGTAFMSELFEHAVKALDRGVKNTFDIAGPKAYRRLLTDDMGIEVAHEDAFPAFREKQKRAERSLGRPMTVDELKVMYPAARVAHLSAESWVEGKIERRALDV
ncbi:glycosyltransferase [Microbacterium phage Dewdrop]|nr:glycosyltransferase [Microbacterium phage Leaf]QGZ17519.1 glycosyltransferase [Microbacterium phage Dewdrop]